MAPAVRGNLRLIVFALFAQGLRTKVALLCSFAERNIPAKQPFSLAPFPETTRTEFLFAPSRVFAWPPPFVARVNMSAPNLLRRRAHLDIPDSKLCRLA